MTSEGRRPEPREDDADGRAVMSDFRGELARTFGDLQANVLYSAQVWSSE